MQLPAPLDRPTVLVVDDEALTRLNVAAIVADAGFRQLPVCNAAEALQVLETCENIRAVLTDIQMPGSMNGLGLVRLIVSRWPAILVLVISGDTSIAGGLPAGVRFVPKPYLPLEIETALRKQLA